jgi:hypothetical protein
VVESLEVGNILGGELLLLVEGLVGHAGLAGLASYVSAFSSQQGGATKDGSGGDGDGWRRWMAKTTREDGFGTEGRAKESEEMTGGLEEHSLGKFG